MKMAKIWQFCKSFDFYPILDCHKIRTKTSFENPSGKSYRVIYPKNIAPRSNRFYSGHFQDTLNIKTFFGYAGSEKTA